MRFPVTEKLIQRQINHWSRLREMLREQPPATEAPPAELPPSTEAPAAPN